MKGATVVFDLDGTIVDTAPDITAALDRTLALDGLAPLSVDETRPLIGGGIGTLLRRGLAFHGRAVSQARFDELAAAFLAAYIENIAVLSRPFPGLGTMLDALDDAGIATAVCTNKREDLARALLGQLGLDRRFRAICGGDTFAAHKPDPMHLLGTIERAGGNVEAAIMVGDSAADLGAGRAAGVPVVLVDYGYTEVPAAELGGDALVSRLADVPAAAERLLAARPVPLA
ncbi:MAG TPA: phosphoglycolate phosphatase [Hyphomicrobiales bacterium]|nr:phosphoglycolate phosphatase [Hyphomicrobiales bacterium]